MHHLLHARAMGEGEVIIKNVEFVERSSLQLLTTFTYTLTCAHGQRAHPRVISVSVVMSNSRIEAS